MSTRTFCTFEELANGHGNLLKLLFSLKAVFCDLPEETICRAFTSLVNAHGQTHIIGNDLWYFLMTKFGKGNEIDYLALSSSISGFLH